MVEHFNPALTLWCVFGFCVISCCFYCFYHLFSILKILEEEVAFNKKVATYAKGQYMFWNNTAHVEVTKVYLV